MKKIKTAEIALIRELFIKRMTVDGSHDRRRRDYNQAIFGIFSDEDIDAWNTECEKYGLKKRQHGDTYPVFEPISLDMVLNCFDKAVQDYLDEKGREPGTKVHTHTREGFDHA